MQDAGSKTPRVPWQAAAHEGTPAANIATRVERSRNRAAAGTAGGATCCAMCRRRASSACAAGRVRRWWLRRIGLGDLQGQMFAAALHARKKLPARRTDAGDEACGCPVICRVCRRFARAEKQKVTAPMRLVADVTSDTLGMQIAQSWLRRTSDAECFAGLSK